MQGFWFGIIAVLWAGFLALEGFDFGVGMLAPVVGLHDGERQQALHTIGPVWDGNEVWLLVAGGATFAAFPEWYASAFSGFYLAFAVLLVGLIIRGIGIEYRGKVETARGRLWCDAGVFVGSLLPAILLGVAFADFIRGVKMNSDHVMTGGFFDLVSPYALLGGLVTLTLFLFHGAVFLALRADGVVGHRASRIALLIAPATAVIAVAFLVWTTQVRGGGLSFVLAALIALTFVASVLRLRVRRTGQAFTLSALVCLLVPVWAFAAMWPNVLPARNHAQYSLTVHNASSSHHTLVVMTVVAVLFTPIVLAYQAWTYWVFRARIGAPATAGGAHPESAVGRLRHKAIGGGQPPAAGTASP
jgi:cytochrome d ubiquinol oxidase subunit II